jgi:hypothetical protein
MAFRNCDIATRSPPPKNGAFFALEIGLSPRIAVLRTVACGQIGNTGTFRSKPRHGRASGRLALRYLCDSI